MSEWAHDPAGLAGIVPKGLALGVSTSAFQVEGAIREGGRGASTWDVFMGQRGRIADGSDASIAADHYHRSREDVRLLRELGVDSYGFSLSWPRLQPAGKGRANAEAVVFYDRLLDELLAAGIRPLITLSHWDLPEELQHKGGWLNRDTAYRLADFAFLAAETLGDRAAAWTTLHEPATVTHEGYAFGRHAPGATMVFDALPAAHHQLLGHGLAVQALRAVGVGGAVGISNSHSPVEPSGDRQEHLRAAELFDLLHNRVFADPVLLGEYPRPSDELEPHFAALREIDPDDLALISAPLDFYGLSYTGPSRVGAGATTLGFAEELDAAARKVVPYVLHPWPEFPVTGTGAPVAPEFLTRALAELAARYGSTLPPVVLTGLGASFPDAAERDGGSAVQYPDDSARTAYLAEHLAAAFAGTPGVTVSGVVIRSLLDGWEWTAGYSQNYGLVRVHPDTQDRQQKASYRWLQRLLGERN